MRRMTDDELIDHLRAWHPDPDAWAKPTHEGQGRTLTAALTTQPGRLATRLDEIKTLRPTYLRAIVRSWELALEADHEVPWEASCPYVSGLAA